MRTLGLAMIVLLALSAPARAETVGIGLFLGEPSGLDLKVALGRRSAIDIVIGQTSFRDSRTDYLHITYLFNLFVARGRSVLVPFRIGIGGVAIGVVDDRARGGLRVPLEIGFRFRRTPVELYGEVAVKGVFVGETFFFRMDVDGGLGIRFYF